MQPEDFVHSRTSASESSSSLDDSISIQLPTKVSEERLFEQSGTSPVACVAGKYRASRRSECAESKRGISADIRSLDYSFSGRINPSSCAIDESGTREFPKHLAGGSDTRSACRSKSGIG